VTPNGTQLLFQMLGLNPDRLAAEQSALREVLTLFMTLQPFLFLDDSGKWHDRDFVCLCGYLSDEDNWNLFLRRWQPLLQKHGLTHIHMAEFYSIANQKGWDKIKIDSVLAEFAAIIRDHVKVGFAVGMDAKHYRALPKTRKHGIATPDVACLQRLLRLVHDKLTAVSYQGRICVTLDEEEGSAIKIYQDILRLRKSNPELGRYIAAVSFADDEFVIPLQAADMLANLTYRFLCAENVNPGRKDDMPEPLKSLLISSSTGQGPEYIHELWSAENLDKALAVLLESGTALAQIRPTAQEPE
jgi:Protein of unknown function (DUF3800)